MVEVIESLALKELISNDIECDNFSEVGSSVNTFSLGSSNMNMGNGRNITASSSTGTKIGTATNQKFGFWGTTPVVQQSAIADPASDTAANNAAIDSILAALRTMGLIAT